MRLAHVESHIPERAQAFVAPLSPLPARLRGARPPAAPRPLRLLERPEPIDVAAELPDMPPLLFRWRRRVHHVAAADGPERIGAEWWRRRAEPRDYYRIEDRDGRRYWVYRDGLWLPERAQPPRWFLHGLFA
jgi:protein ImuB